MSMTDRYIISQVRLIALELVGLGVILLVFWVTVMNGSGSQFDPAAQRWENGLQTVIRIFLPVFCLLWMLLLYRIYKKLFWSSLFGPSAVLYQSLPVSMTAAVSGKILLSGFCILLPGAVVLPRLGGIMVSGLMNGLYDFTDSLVQILVNLGGVRENTPVILTLAAADLILGCFAMSGAALFAVVHCQKKGGGVIRQTLELLVLAGSVPLVMGAAILAVISLGTGLMIPGLVKILGYEVILLVAAERKSVMLLESM